MKKLYFLFVAILVSIHSYGQDRDRKTLDLIIVINDEIAVGSIASLKIKAISTKETSYVIEPNYYPGNLSMPQSSYDRLVSEDVKTIYLTMDYYEYSNGEQTIYNYEIELKKPWLQDQYNILRIFDLSKKKYRKSFDPLEKGKDYTFVLDSPNHTFRRVKR